MKKMLTTRNLFFMSIFFMLILCLVAAPSFSAPKSSKSAPTSAPKTSKSESPSYSTTPFDDTWKSLPKNYNGHDIVAVLKSLSKNLDNIKKDEFETKEQYKQRRDAAWRKPILGQMVHQDNFAFVYEPEKMYDAENSQFTIKIENPQNLGVVLQESRIGEDKRGQETLKRIHRDEKRKKIMRGKGTYNTDTAASVLGAAIEEAGIREIFSVFFSEEDCWPKLKQIAVDMPPEEAGKNNEKIRALFVGSIANYSPRNLIQISIFSGYLSALKLYLKKVIIFNYQTGEIYRTIDMSDDAYGNEIKIRDLSKAIELDPKDPQRYYNRGEFYWKLKQYNEVIRDSSKAIELDPKYAPSYLLRGVSYLNLAQYDEAIRDYNKAIELDPNNARYYTLRAMAYASMKRCNEAIRDSKKAIELDPERTKSFEFVRKICYGN